MLNIFNKKEKNTQQEVVVSENKYPAIVHEIHNEFLTAGDKILDEANNILEESKKTSMEKGKRLAALGFKKCPEAVNATQLEQKNVITKTIAELVNYYLINYPDNKFITEAAVKQICKKYGLICGGVGLYKGFVPEAKLKLIENFSLNKNDKAEHYFEVFNGGRSELPRYFITEKDLTEDGKGYFIKRNNTGYITDGYGRGIYSTPQFTEECLAEFSGHHFVEIRPTEDRGMQICAPLKDMEVPSGKQIKDYRIQNIPDPVVLQPVKGGYLIVCAWGDEATDPMIVNEINN